MTEQEAPTEDPRPVGLRNAESLVVVLTGNGKGKSSSAFGMVLRAIARDWKVAVVQFIKSGDWLAGEQKVGERLGVTWLALGAGFTWDSDDLEHDKAIARDAWKQAADLIASGDFDLVVLDEITYLPTWNWIPVSSVVDSIANRPSHVNVICTGRDAPNELIEIADTVTSMTNVKHAYDSGIAAKRGIDY